MRLFLCVALILLTAMLSGCLPPYGATGTWSLVTVGKGVIPNVSIDNSVEPSKVGRARAEYVPFVAFGDCSIKAAMLDGEITKIHHIDYETVSVIFFYGKFETVVYGQ